MQYIQTKIFNACNFSLWWLNCKVMCMSIPNYQFKFLMNLDYSYFETNKSSRFYPNNPVKN